MTVRYKSATVDEFIENHSHHISRGGIFIKTRAPFPAGTLLKFEVRIDATSGTGCNCTVCTKVATLGAIARPDAFRLLSGEK